MADIGIGSRKTATQNRLSEVEDPSGGWLDGVEAKSSEEPVDGSSIDPLHRHASEALDRPGEQARAASLRDRTVPRWERRGALGGTLVAAAGVGVATGVLFGIGKGAAIGALVGSIIPGAGTVVGAVVGAVVGGLVLGGAAAGIGALIGRLAAGGSDRNRAEKLIAGLYDKGQITADEGKRLRGLSNSDVSALVSISAGKTGIAAKAGRDAIRRAVLVTAARAGVDEAKRFKAALLAGPIDLGPGAGWPRHFGTTATMDKGKQQQFVQEIVTNLEKSNPRSDDGLPPLASQFWRDVGPGQTRVTVVHGKADTATLTLDGQPQAELKKLVGSDEAAYNLSKFLSQTPLDSMVGAIRVEDSAGRRVVPMLSAQRTQGVTVTRRNDDTGQPVIDMDFAMEGRLRGLNVGPRADDEDGQMLEAQAGSHFSYKARLQIPVADLQSGQVDAFRIVEPPRLHLGATVQPL